MPAAFRTALDPGRLLAALLACGLGPGVAIASDGTPAVDSTASYLQRMDSDGDGRVSLDEYLAWMGYGFERMDRNGDGVLSADELPGGRGRALTRADHQAQLRRRFARQDADGDGFLSARELAAPPR